MADDPESLFVLAEEDDAQWDPPDYENEDEESMGWDASIQPVSVAFALCGPHDAHRMQDAGFQTTFRDTQSLSRSHSVDDVPDGLPPTQRISQVSRGC